MTSALTQYEGITRSEWNTTLGELCDRFGGGIQTGPFGSQLHAADYSEHGTPVVMPQDLVNGRIVCDRIARVPERIVLDLSRHALRFGDVVFSRRGDVTRFAVLTHEQEGWLCGTGCIRIRLNCPDVDIPYFRQYLQQNSVGKWLIHQANGVTMPNLNTEIVRALPFVYPPLQEQRRIAAILDKADALRQKRSLALQKLNILTQSIFHEMFGDPIENSYGHPIKTLLQLVDRTRPISYGILMPGPNQNEGVPYVRVADMRDGGIDLRGIRRTSDEISNAYRRSLLRKGDLLMSIRGHVGRLASVPDDLDGANITQDSARLAVTEASAVYVRECLRHPGMQRWMATHTKGVAVRGINLEDVKRVPIPIPPEPLQRKFGRLASKCEVIRQSECAAVENSNAILASIRHRAFRGEL